MDSWLFPLSKKVYICIFWTSITEVVTIGVTAVKKLSKYLVYIIFEYEIHFPIAHLLKVQKTGIF